MGASRSAAKKPTRISELSSPGAAPEPLFPLGDPGGVTGGRAGANTVVNFRLADPVTQSFAVDVSPLFRPPGDRPAVGVGVLAGFDCHASGPCP